MGYKLITPQMRREPSTWMHSYWEHPELKGAKRVLCEEHQLTYHCSWNSLIPVVEKTFQFPAYPNLHMKLNDALLTLNIEEVYDAVFEIIKKLKDGDE